MTTNEITSVQTLSKVARMVREMQGLFRAAGETVNKPDKARSFANQGKYHCIGIINALVSLGADYPPLPQPAALDTGSDHRKRTAEQCDTPDMRRLLELLEAARVVAARVDAGYPSTMNGERVDLGETIRDLARRLRWDVEGPKDIQ